jgi:hypothetical protein
MNTIKKTFQYTQKDLQAFYNVLIYKRTILPLCSIIPLVLIVGFLIAPIFHENSSAAHYVSLGIVFSIVITSIMLVFSPKESAKKTLEQNIFFKHEVSVEFSAEGFKDDCHGASAFIKWEDVYNYFEDKKTFAVFVSEENGYIIPKRLFSETETVEISALLKERIVTPKMRKQQNKNKNNGK